jgi:hypothetical protein
LKVPSAGSARAALGPQYDIFLRRLLAHFRELLFREVLGHWKLSHGTGDERYPKCQEQPIPPSEAENPRIKLVATASFSSRRIGVTSACPEAQAATWFGSFGDDPEAVALVERHILWPYCPEIGRDSVSVCTIQN